MKFQKGHIPWHKGKTLSVEIRKKLSDAHKGKLHPSTLKNLRKMATASRGVKRTEEIRKKIGDAHRGEKCTFWQGGKTEKHRMVRNSLEYKLWREAVFKRDNFTCVWCGDHNYKGRGKTVVLHADHIKPFWKFPELRFSIDNGRILCVPCHKTTTTWGRPKND